MHGKVFPQVPENSETSGGGPGRSRIPGGRRDQEGRWSTLRVRSMKTQHRRADPRMSRRTTMTNGGTDGNELRNEGGRGRSCRGRTRPGTARALVGYLYEQEGGD